MKEIDYGNIVQLHPVRKRTWAVYADENEEDKFFVDEIECWALIERVRQCKRREAPTFFVGKTPCIRETLIRPLFMHEMTTSAYASEGANLLGYSRNPGAAKAAGRAEAEKYLNGRKGAADSPSAEASSEAKATEATVLK